MILLDTHVWLWWLSNPKQLSRRARATLETAVAESAIAIASISAWEVTMLVKRGRLRLSTDPADWIARSEELPFVTFVPMDTTIAIRSVQLDPLHNDPADRIIVATAIGLGVPLVTKDNKIRDFPGLQCIW